jgi:hypothetical protein
MGAGIHAFVVKITGRSRIDPNFADPGGTKDGTSQGMM